jgi:heme-degrading monooxygenase HmoA
MTAMNVVRFRVKPGNEQKFIDAHRKIKRSFKGFLGGRLVRTGEQTFCMIGEWRTFKSIAAARPQMIELLDGFRGMLEDLGGGLGVTDPISGDVVVRITPPKARKPRAAKGLSKPAAARKPVAAARKRAPKKRTR